jgi:hypothetical protein
MLTFKHEPTDCEFNGDDMHVLMNDGKETPISIQVALYAGGYFVNRYFYDAAGKLEGVEEMSKHRSLEAAKAAAIALFGRTTT